MNLNDLISEESLHRLATPADFRLGREIAAQGAVEIVELSPNKVVAKVKPQGGQKRTVILSATPEGLKCRCT